MISIVIPTTGRKELLVQCLARVINTTKHLDVEIIVVIDNDEESRKASEEVLSASGRPYTIDYGNEYRGPCGAINAGLAHTKGEYIIGVGDDSVVETGWIDEAIRVMQEKFPDGDGMVGCNDGHQDGNHLSTVPLLTRRFIARHLGGVWAIPGYRKWFGDIEMTARAKAVGKYAYAPNAIIRHNCPQAGGRAEDATDLRFKHYIPEDEALCHKRHELNWPNDFPPIITE